MVFAKGVLAVPLLDLLVVIFVEIEALFLRDVEVLMRDALAESETLGMRDVEILEDALSDTDAVVPRGGETTGDIIIVETEDILMETEGLKY